MAYFAPHNNRRHCFLEESSKQASCNLDKIHPLLSRVPSVATTACQFYTPRTSLVNITSNNHHARFERPLHLHLSSQPSTATIPPQTMETTHRKIELQSPLDLLYLHSNASSLLQSKLDLHFPPSAAPASAADDILKSRVEELVTVYLDRVFNDAKANLSINGLEGEEMEEAMKLVEGKGEGEFFCFSLLLNTEEEKKRGGRKRRMLTERTQTHRTRTLRFKTRRKTKIPFFANRALDTPSSYSTQRSPCKSSHRLHHRPPRLGCEIHICQKHR